MKFLPAGCRATANLFKRLSVGGPNLYSCKAVQLELQLVEEPTHTIVWLNSTCRNQEAVQFLLEEPASGPEAMYFHLASHSVPTTDFQMQNADTCIRRMDATFTPTAVMLAQQQSCSL